MNSVNARKKARKKARNSSIELLKVIGIILIVVSHVVQTLSDINTYISYQDYIVDLRLATTNVQYLLLSMLRYSGSIGNTIFFVCSAWYLLDSNKTKTRNILQMLMDVWVISIFTLLVVYVLRNGHIGAEMIIKQIFPTIFANNWYITCYLLFYPVHSFLNIIIMKIEKSTLLKTTLVMLFLYYGINYLHSGHFFTSQLIRWIAIYFAIAYMKLYLTDISNNFKISISAFAMGFIGNCGIIIFTNILGLHMRFFSDKLLHWPASNNLFTLLMVIGLFNVTRNVHIENRFVNYISSMSMLIYIIHENMLLRTYYRPLMWQYVYINLGYDHILFWTIVLVLIVLLFGLVSSIVYKYTTQKLVTRIVDKLYPKLCNGYFHMEKVLLKLH